MHVKSFGYAALWAVLAFGAQSAFGQQSGAYNFGYPTNPASFHMAGNTAAAGGPAQIDVSQAPLGGGVGCANGVSCSSGCGAGCSCEACCPQGWIHRWNVFGEFLSLRPRNAEIAYAVPVNGIIGPAAAGVAGLPGVQQGAVGVVDPDFHSGYRVGAGFTLDECSAIQLSYTNYNADTLSTITTNAPDVLRSLVLVPDTINADTDFLDAAASQNIQFELADVDYRGLLAYSDDYKIAYLAGLRYATLDQSFTGAFAQLGVTRVDSTVHFDGFGLRVGMEAERYGRNRQMFVYGKSYASLMAGQTFAAYAQQSDAAGLEAFTSWRAGRLASIYDLEIGAGWENYCGNFRLSAGYMFSIWTNVVKNNEWINAVRTNNFVDPSDNFNGMMTFDGFVARAEVLW